MTAALLKAYAADSLTKQIDRVAIGVAPGTGEKTAFAVYSPHGDRGPHFDVRVNVEQASKEPAEQNLAKTEQLQQQQALAQQESLQRGQDEPGRGGPRMG
ncbi:hypothetical protein [Lysobacter sp. CA196]|uniref:hypothetical protein n=1 Tax=Lysobacter sp. CA196 TaxID=3455606 RepID=UPI003F8CF5E5